jgi:hypothetical protein
VTPSATETLAIPASIRNAVDERDGRMCRFCGRYLGNRRVIHHIFYGGDDAGMGGRRNHTLENCITLCGDYDGGCHSRVHADKKTWQYVLAILAKYDELTMTALQYWRWSQT